MASRSQKFSVDSSVQILTQTTTPSRETQTLSPIKLGIVRAIPMVTFISAIGIVIMTYCFFICPSCFAITMGKDDDS